MNSRAQNAIAPFLQCHSSLTTFNEHEHALLESSIACLHSYEPGTYIRGRSDSRDQPYIVSSGWACYMRAMHDGRCQIFSFILPGDSIGLAEGPFGHGRAEILALTTVALLDAANIKHALMDSKCPNLRTAFDSERRLQETWLLDHVVRLGQHSALERTAHLLLELYHRLDRAGLVRDKTFQLPLSQTQMGQALGLSLVHINRTIQALRKDDLLALNGRNATLPRLHALSRIAGFRPEQQLGDVSRNGAAIDPNSAQAQPPSVSGWKCPGNLRS